LGTALSISFDLPQAVRNPTHRLELRR